MIAIKILGPGCSNCRKVEAVARQAVADLSLDARFVKVTDRAEILQYPILATPGLVIDERLVCAGRIPAEAEVTTWLSRALLQEQTGMPREQMGESQNRHICERGSVHISELRIEM